MTRDEEIRYQSQGSPDIEEMEAQKEAIDGFKKELSNFINSYCIKHNLDCYTPEELASVINLMDEDFTDLVGDIIIGMRGYI